MRVGLISHEYPPFTGGGIGTYTTSMARLLAQHGHEVHVVTNMYSFGSDPVFREPHSIETTDAGGALHVHRVRGISDDWGPPPGASARQVRVYQDWSPYLMYAESVAERVREVHGEYRLDIAEFPECAAEGYGVIHRRRLGMEFLDLPTTVTLHSPIEEIYAYNHYARQNLGFQQRKSLEDRTILEADGVNAPSRRLMEMVRTRLGIGTEDERVWDCIRLPLVFGELPEPGAPRANARASILAVGRVEPRKGVIDLTDAVAPLMERYPDFTLDLIGRDCDAGIVPGRMSDFLRSRLPPAHRDRLIFHGQITRSELFRRFASATAVVFASRWDNYPVTCLEAMAAGACCVVSDGIGTAEVLTDGEDAILFPAGDVGALGDRLDALLSDASAAEKIGSNSTRAARAIADPGAAVRARLAHYERVIASANAPRRASSSRVSIAWTPTGNQLTDESVRAAAARAGATLRPGVDLAETTDASYRLHVPAGDTLAPESLSNLLDVMSSRPDAAWAGPWAQPRSAGGPMYAGQDFTLPLSMLADLAPRTVLLRSSSLTGLEFAHASLPESYRVADLRLSLHERGWAGLAVPAWLTTAGDGSGDAREKLDGTRRALLLERLAERHQGLLREHGAALWIYTAANAASAGSGLGDRGGSGVPTPELGFRGTVWNASKQLIKRRFPRLAAWARGVSGRR